MKRKKLLSIILVFAVILTMCTVGMLTASADSSSTLPHFIVTEKVDGENVVVTIKLKSTDEVVGAASYRFTYDADVFELVSKKSFEAKLYTDDGIGKVSPNINTNNVGEVRGNYFLTFGGDDTENLVSGDTFDLVAFTFKLKNGSFRKEDIVFGDYVFYKVDAGKIADQNTEGTEPEFIIDCPHTNTKDVVNEVATCTKAGSKDVLCSVCNEKLRTESIPQLEHSWDSGNVTTEPTCTDKGQKTYKCTYNCGTTKTEDIDPTGHNWSDVAEFLWSDDYSGATIILKCTNNEEHTKEFEVDSTSETTAADCEKGGSTVYTVSQEFEGKTYSDKQTVYTEATGHSWKQSTVEWADDYSYATFVLECENNKEHTKELKVYSTSKTTAAACESDGSTVYSVSTEFEGKTYTDSQTVKIPATGHKYSPENSVVTKPATCTDAGVRTYTCDNGCGTQKTEEIPATGHKYSSENSVVTKPATCTDAGVRTYTCDNGCGTQKTEEIPATGHNYDYENGVRTKEPTCTDTGLITYTCKNGCNIPETKEIPATGHNYDYENGVRTKEPTCTDTGLITYTCKNGCGIPETKEIPATGHDYDYDNGVETKPATCTDTGTVTYTCKNGCGIPETKEIPAKGHTYDDGVETKAATCTEAGEMTFTCTVCGDTYAEEIPAKGHTYDGGVETKSATCTEAGEMTFTCTVCGDTYAEEIPAKGHSWDEGVVTKEPTEEETGEKTYTCTVCGETYAEEIPVLSETSEEPSENNTVLEDRDTEIKVEGVFEDGLRLLVESIPVDNEAYPDVLAEFDISLIDSQNAAVQPNGMIKISIPFDEEGCKVIWLKDDGTTKDMGAVYENGCYVFTTDHLSVYQIVKDSSEPDDNSTDGTSQESDDNSTVDEPSHDQPNSSADDNNGKVPTTGDNSIPVAVMISVLVISGAAICIMKKKSLNK